MSYQAHELPLVLVQCCTRYVVSALHWCPPCRLCDEFPTYVGETAWWLEFLEAG